MHYEQSIQFFSHFVRTSTKRESSRPEKRSLSDEDEDDEMMTAARENLDPKIQSRSGLSTLHLSSSLSHRNTRRPSRISSTLAKDETRLFSLSHEQRHRHHHHHHHQKEMMMMMMIKEDHRKTLETTAKEEENAP